MARRRRKKSVASVLLEEATKTLPAPLQLALGGPKRMIGVVLVLGVLVSCGIVTIQWQGSRPTLQVNNEKVQEYRDETEGWLKRYRDRLANQPDEEPPIVETVQRFQSTLGGGETPTIRR